MSESSTCTRCQALFTCGMEVGQERCWCADYPPTDPDSEATACLCPACLREVVQKQSTLTHESGRSGPARDGEAED